MSDSIDFWDWAVAAYARPGVAELCLDLQDAHGQNVPLLLWAVWAGESGRRVDAAQAVATARAWQEVIAPLRDVRRRLKTTVTEGDDAQRLAVREQVKGVELSAEKALMTLLESQSPPATLDVVALSVIPGARNAVVLDGVLAVATAWNPDAPLDRLAQLSARLLEG